MVDWSSLNQPIDHPITQSRICTPPIPNRDLFDLAAALERLEVGAECAVRIVAAFSEYMSRDGHRVTRAQFEKNMAAKIHDPQFHADISPLLAGGHKWDVGREATLVTIANIRRVSRVNGRQSVFSLAARRYGD